VLLRNQGTVSVRVFFSSCQVFILPDSDDLIKILGYYTLSPALLRRSLSSTKDQKKIPPGLPIPMMLIGFMGATTPRPFAPEKRCLWMRLGV
jgi:hypothetical protein